MEKSVRLAESLPPLLLRFFTKFPPPQIQAATAIPQQAQAASEPIQIASTTSPTDPNANITTEFSTSTDITPIMMTKNEGPKKSNPFLPFKNPRTGRWHAPVYSLRRQSVLFKLAQSNGVLSLMPYSQKHPEVKDQKRIEHGIRVQGTGVGKKVKGKAWERTLRTRLEQRRKAMEGMPEMIRQWKERGHGRGWKKWPR